MDYAEHAPPPALDGLVKAIWTLDCGGGVDWVEHAATPDGCIEIIRRLHGRSIWKREQPEFFATGVSEVPARIRLSGDARFIGVRLWPWAWEMLTATPCPGFRDTWLPLAPGDRAARLLVDRANIGAALIAAYGGLETPILARAILRCASVGALAAQSGLSHRAIQRWFARHIAIAPRRYLKLLRFQQALAGLQHDPAPIAAQAAARGYADQAHMARDFREITGAPAVAIRAKARGPFI